MKYITEDMNIENEHISKYLLYVLVYDDNILGDAILPFTMDIPNLTMEMLNKDNGRILKLIIPKINTMVKNKILDIRMVPKSQDIQDLQDLQNLQENENREYAIVDIFGIINVNKVLKLPDLPNLLELDDAILNKEFIDFDGDLENEYINPLLLG